MDSSRAVLQLMYTPGIGAKTVARVLWQFEGERRSIDDLLAISRDELIRHYRLRADLAEGFSASREKAARLADQLEEHRVETLLITMPQYPRELKKTLKDSAPPILFASGNVTILERNGVGISGARDASETGLKIAGDCAQMLGQCGINVISGHANGVDLAAHRGALEVGGVTTLVLAEGILHFRVKRDLRDVFDRSNILVLSEFPPMLGWIARNAMQRNRTICGLSDVVIVVESGTSGGTFAAGQTALDLRRPLFVVDYPEPAPSAAGNHLLLNAGAQPLAVNGSGNLLNMMDVFNAIEAREDTPSTGTTSSQLSLDLA